MKTFRITVEGKEYQVQVEEVQEGTTQPAPTPVPAPAASPAPAPAAPASRPDAQPVGSGALTAPMPGTVLKILVVEGEKVEYGQTLLVLEAMKMENGINANAAGVVADIQVSPGQSVDTGQLLLTIK